MKAQDQWKNINHEDEGNKALLLIDLYERWEDEYEYEDLDDYLAVIKHHIPDAYEITEEPFGIKIKCDDGILAIRVIDDGEHLKLQGVITRGGK